MTTVISVSGGINSAYLLWDTAKNSNDDIVAVHFDIKSYAMSDRNEYYNYPKANTSAANNVVNWVSENVRPITYHYLTLDKYVPKYGVLGFLETANYSLSISNVSSVVLSDGLESSDNNSVKIRSAVTQIANNVFFPLIQQNLSTADCIDALPATLLNICHKNQYYKGITVMKAANNTNQQILTEIHNIIGNGPTPYQKILSNDYYVDSKNNSKKFLDNKYFCDSSEYFGSITFEYPIQYLAPHVKIIR